MPLTSWRQEASEQAGVPYYPILIAALLEGDEVDGLRPVTDGQHGAL